LDSAVDALGEAANDQRESDVSGSGKGTPAGAPDAAQVQPDVAEVRRDDLLAVRDPTAGKAALEQLERRAADEQLVREMRAQAFAGPLYRSFQEELVRYSMSVLAAWMYSGYIFTLSRDRGISLRPNAIELAELRDDRQLRQDLAAMTVAAALPKFRESALVGGGWSSGRGASIATFFMGATLYSFANEFRRHRSASRREGREFNTACGLARQDGVISDNFDVAIDAGASEHLLDPGRQVPANLQVEEHLARLRPRERAAVRLNLAGYTHEEIAEVLATSTRAVEGLLYRWRTAEQKRLANQSRGARR
jgi:DNA-directed RNA polymerase specialized sigma24 family protein